MPADNLLALDEWADSMLAKFTPAARKRLAQQIARDLRRSQMQRIARQENPDGSAFAPRRPRVRNGKRVTLRRKMFPKLRQAKHLKLKVSNESISLMYLGRTGRLARIHQYGLRDRAQAGAPETQYDKRVLLGMSADDYDMIRAHLIDHLE